MMSLMCLFQNWGDMLNDGLHLSTEGFDFLIELQHYSWKHVISIRFENSVDLEFGSTLCSVILNLDRHCFQNRINLGSAGQGLR